MNLVFFVLGLLCLAGAIVLYATESTSPDYGQHEVQDER